MTIQAFSTSDGKSQGCDKLNAYFGQALGYGRAKNYIINGNFDIWQRGTSFNAVGYTADRWYVGANGSTFVNTQQPFTLGQTDVSNEPTYFYRSVVTSVAGVGNRCYLIQKIGSVRTTAGKSVSLSFYAKADAAKSISIEFLQDFGTGGSPSAAVTTIGVNKINLTASWQKFTIENISIPSISGKTLGSNNNDNLAVWFWFDAGSNFNARTSSLGQQSGTFDIAQVQLEEGPNSTNFEWRHMQQEITLCQRYYEKSYSLTTAPGTNTTVGAVSFYAGSAYLVIGNQPFKVEKRAVPTMSIYTPAGTLGSVFKFDDSSSISTIIWEYTSTSNTGRISKGAGGMSAGTYVWQWVADAEL